MTRSGSKRLLTTPRSIRPDHRGTIHTRFLGHTHIYNIIYIILYIYYIILYYIYNIIYNKGIEEHHRFFVWKQRRLVLTSKQNDRTSRADGHPLDNGHGGMGMILSMGISNYDPALKADVWKILKASKLWKKGPHVFFSALWVFLLNFWGMPKNAPQSGWFQMLKHV